MKKSLELGIGLLGLMVALCSLEARATSAYDALSAEQKYQVLSARLAEHRSSTLPPLGVRRIWRMPKLFCERYLRVSFLGEPGAEISDGMPADRDKLIHPNGLVAGVRFEANPAAGYTGLFQTGAIGFLRLSIAGANVREFTPGIGLKLLVDGHRSANLVAMYSLTGQGADQNPFLHSFVTNIARPERMGWLQRRLLAAFQRTVDRLPESVGGRMRDPFTIALDELASVRSSGEAVSAPLVPYALEFQPAQMVSQFFSVGWNHVTDPVNPVPHADFRHALLASGIGTGGILYEVYAHREGAPQSDRVLVGRIVLTTDFFHSDFELFFRHPVAPLRTIAGAM